jgi:hypothetical protein
VPTLIVWLGRLVHMILRSGAIEKILSRERGGKMRSGMRLLTVRFFVACFSREYAMRAKSYMNEELTLDIDELRQRPANKTWFIPVLLSDGDIPDRNIGAGETL